MARGGKILGNGETYTVKVKAGTNRVVVLDDGGAGIADTNVAVAKGQTKQGFVTAAAGLTF